MAALLRVSAACLLDLIDTVRRGVGARPLGVDSGRSNLGRRPARVLRDRRRAGRCGPGLLDGRDSFADDKPFDDAFAELAELAVTHTEAAIRLGIVNGRLVPGLRGHRRGDRPGRHTVADPPARPRFGALPRRGRRRASRAAASRDGLEDAQRPFDSASLRLRPRPNPDDRRLERQVATAVAQLRAGVGARGGRRQGLSSWLGGHPPRFHQGARRPCDGDLFRRWAACGDGSRSCSGRS